MVVEHGRAVSGSAALAAESLIGDEALAAAAQALPVGGVIERAGKGAGVVRGKVV